VPWHFGGGRFYFLCDCGRRVGKLFALSGSLWRCRHRHDLTYATRQAALRYRLIRKAQKIRERLEGSLGVLDDFPPKPKGMNWRRYQRLRQTHDQAVENSLAMLGVYATPEPLATSSVFRDFSTSAKCRLSPGGDLIKN
jgi:hypothetical protein